MRIAIFFATREGQTRRIAERLASDLHERGIDTEIHDVRHLHQVPDWSRYATAIVAASIHAGRHEREMIAFAKQHRTVLADMKAAFVSVSLSERGVEDLTLPEDRRREHAAAVAEMIERFVDDTGWHPARVLPVAGALAYRQYNFFIRFVMKRIARANGAPIDTSRNHDLTDWDRVDRFAAEFVV